MQNLPRVLLYLILEKPHHPVFKCVYRTCTSTQYIMFPHQFNIFNTYYRKNPWRALLYSHLPKNFDKSAILWALAEKYTCLFICRIIAFCLLHIFGLLLWCVYIIKCKDRLLYLLHWLAYRWRFILCFAQPYWVSMLPLAFPRL